MAITRSSLILVITFRYRCDFWSTAVVILEAALGYYPFTSESTHLDVGDVYGIKYQLEKAITGNKAASILGRDYHFTIIMQKM